MLSIRHSLIEAGLWIAGTQGNEALRAGAALARPDLNPIGAGLNRRPRRWRGPGLITGRVARIISAVVVVRGRVGGIVVPIGDPVRRRRRGRRVIVVVWRLPPKVTVMFSPA